MRKLVHVFFFLVLAGSRLWAQKELTTFQVLFNLEGAAPASSASVRNIGQASHAAYVLFTNKPGQVCAAGAVDIGWEQSYTGVVWSRFGDQLAAIAVNPDGQLATVIQAYGAYPRVRLKIRSFDTVKCAVSAWYSGSVAGQANISLTAGAMTVANAPNVRPLANIAYSVGYDSGLLAVPHLAAATVTANNTLLHTLYCNNSTAAAVSLTVTNDAGGDLYATAFQVPANSFGALINLYWPVLVSGVKWQASAAGLKCQVAGLQ